MLQALARHSGYSESEVLPCARQLVTLMQNAPTNSLNAVYKVRGALTHKHVRPVIVVGWR